MPKKGDSGKRPKERAGPVRVDLPFDEALRAALETPPAEPPLKSKKRKQR